MEEAALRVIEQDLLHWGILERAEALQISRRFRGAVARAAMRLAEEEKAGRRPEGHPVARTVEAAMAEYPLPPGAVATAEHRRFVTVLEIAALPAGVREFLEKERT